MFDLHLTTPAQKDLDGLEQIMAVVVEELMALKSEHQKGHPLKQNLQGIRSLDFTIKGSGQFRAAYIVIESDHVCLIIAIGPRENFYDLVARRAKQMKELLKEVKSQGEKPSRVKKPKKS